MGWNVPKTGGGNGDGEPREQCPAGSRVAVLVALIDLGHQETRDYDDPTKTVWRHQVCGVFEVQGPETSAGEPFYFAERFTVSTEPLARLRKLMNLINIPEDEDDIELLLGKAFRLKIEEATSNKGNDYTRLKKDGILDVPEEMLDRVTEPVRQPFVWRLGDEDIGDYDWLPWLYGKKLADVVAASREARQQKQKEEAEEAGEVQRPARQRPAAAQARTQPHDPPAPAAAGKPPIRQPQPAVQGYQPAADRDEPAF